MTSNRLPTRLSFAIRMTPKERERYEPYCSENAENESWKFGGAYRHNERVLKTIQTRILIPRSRISTMS